MPAIADEIGEAVEIIRREYSGRIEVASDLKTYELI
jgi:hypothetical protein